MVVYGVVYVYVMFNNMMVFILDLEGNVLMWFFVGCVGFKGFCKGMLFVVQVVVQNVGYQVCDYGVCLVDVEVKGFGGGCEFVVCVLQLIGILIKLIKDVMLILYNGCCFCKCCCV